MAKISPSWPVLVDDRCVEINETRRQASRVLHQNGMGQVPGPGWQLLSNGKARGLVYFEDQATGPLWHVSVIQRTLKETSLCQEAPFSQGEPLRRPQHPPFVDHSLLVRWRHVLPSLSLSKGDVFYYSVVQSTALADPVECQGLQVLLAGTRVGNPSKIRLAPVDPPGDLHQERDARVMRSVVIGRTLDGRFGACTMCGVQRPIPRSRSSRDEPF